MSNKYSFYQLRMACQQKLLASLYTEPDDPDAYNAGVIEAVTPRHVLLWNVTPWGERDGWLLRRTEDVMQVFMGDDYEIRLQMLLEMNGLAFSPLLETPPAQDADLLRLVLQHAAASHELVSILTEEDTFTGTVESLDDLRASVNVLDFFGQPEGRKLFALRDMQVVAVDTQEERMYARLRDERLKLL